VPACHRLLQVFDEHRLLDLLTGEVALHERLVLALGDDRLDELVAGLLDDGRCSDRDRGRGRVPLL
jgi:hypothetical protein